MSFNTIMKIQMLNIVQNKNNSLKSFNEIYNKTDRHVHANLYIFTNKMLSDQFIYINKMFYTLPFQFYNFP